MPQRQVLPTLTPSGPKHARQPAAAAAAARNLPVCPELQGIQASPAEDEGRRQGKMDKKREGRVGEVDREEEEMTKIKM